MTTTRPRSGAWWRRSWGPKAKLGHGGTQDEHKARKEAAEKEKKTTIAAESFENQVADKMGGFFGRSFLPARKKLVKAGLSYDRVKRLVEIPPTWGARIDGEQFVERTASPSGDEKAGATARKK